MIHQAVKVRIYPNSEQKVILAQNFGSARWWWNYALNKCIETYKATGKGLTRTAMNSMLPKLKKEKETEWLKDCYSQIYQSVSLNLSRAYLNFFAGRARYPRFKSKFGKQSIQYPQNVSRSEIGLKFPGRLGNVKAKIHRPLEGELKTVTVSMTNSGKYFASILLEKKGDYPEVGSQDKVIGIDLGIKDFAITNDGKKTSKYANPRHLKRHHRNLKRKQQKLARKQKGSNSRNKARKLVAKVYERISNVRQDFLHKLSRKIVNNNQVVVVENLHIKGMVCNHKLAKAISDCGATLRIFNPLRNAHQESSWGTFVNLLEYKLKEEGKVLLEIDRFFPSSKTCSNCHHQIDKLPLDIRNWSCSHCGKEHDRDENAAINIRQEGIRILKLSPLGTSGAADGGDVRPRRGNISRLGSSL